MWSDLHKVDEMRGCVGGNTEDARENAPRFGENASCVLESNQCYNSSCETGSWLKSAERELIGSDP